MTTMTTNINLDELYAQATAKLNSLNISLDYLSDESGQTSAEEHLTWIINTDETEIRQWLSDMEN
jgi:hypothetical protein